MWLLVGVAIGTMAATYFDSNRRYVGLSGVGFTSEVKGNHSFKLCEDSSFKFAAFAL